MIPAMIVGKVWAPVVLLKMAYEPLPEPPRPMLLLLEEIAMSLPSAQPLLPGGLVEEPGCYNGLVPDGKGGTIPGKWGSGRLICPSNYAHNTLGFSFGF